MHRNARSLLGRPEPSDTSGNYRTGKERPATDGSHVAGRKRVPSEVYAGCMPASPAFIGVSSDRAKGSSRACTVSRARRRKEWSCRALLPHNGPEDCSRREAWQGRKHRRNVSPAGVDSVQLRCSREEAMLLSDEFKGCIRLEARARTRKINPRRNRDPFFDASLQRRGHA